MDDYVGALCRQAARTREAIGPAMFQRFAIGGGTPTTPVGTVFIALATANGVEARKFLNVWDRLTFKEVTGTQALAWLLNELGETSNF